jgi:hypothetical protein
MAEIRATSVSTVADGAALDAVRFWRGTGSACASDGVDRDACGRTAA